MVVRFVKEGGLAYFPGLPKPVSIDTNQLKKEDAEELEGLVEGARFFELPTEIGSMPSGAADYFTFTITIDKSGRAHTLRIVEPVTDPALLKLVEWLSRISH